MSEEPATEFPARARAAWARLIGNVYEADPLEHRRCKGPIRVIALLEDPGVIRRIFEHLRLWAPRVKERVPPFDNATRPPARQPAAVQPSVSDIDSPVVRKIRLGAAKLRELACHALAVGIDCAIVGRQIRSMPARIAVHSRGRSSRHEYEDRFTDTAISSALAPGARAQRTGIKAGLNFLSVVVVPLPASEDVSLPHLFAPDRLEIWIFILSRYSTMISASAKRRGQLSPALRTDGKT
jgi:hypothetical protein